MAPPPLSRFQTDLADEPFRTPVEAGLCWERSSAHEPAFANGERAMFGGIVCRKLVQRHRDRLRSIGLEKTAALSMRTCLPLSYTLGTGSRRAVAENAAPIQRVSTNIFNVAERNNFRLRRNVDVAGVTAPSNRPSGIPEPRSGNFKRSPQSPPIFLVAATANAPRPCGRNHSVIKPYL
jgi:hypothetical protein